MKHISRRNESVDRSSFSSIGILFHARGAATEKAMSLIRRRVRGTTMLPYDEARNVNVNVNQKFLAWLT